MKRNRPANTPGGVESGESASQSQTPRTQKAKQGQHHWPSKCSDNRFLSDFVRTKNTTYTQSGEESGKGLPCVLEKQTRLSAGSRPPSPLQPLLPSRCVLLVALCAVGLPLRLCPVTPRLPQPRPFGHCRVTSTEDSAWLTRSWTNVPSYFTQTRL